MVAQIALSLALLVTSGLFFRTLRNISSADPGFEQDHILTASVGLNIAGYPDEEARVIRHKILDRVAALPGITVASLTDWVPFNFNFARLWMRIQKRDMFHVRTNLLNCAGRM